MRTRVLVIVCVLAALLGVGASAPVEAVAPCVGRPAPDEWPTFGRDLANSRHQELPGGINTSTAPFLQAEWAFTTSGSGTGLGDLNGTPIVSAGCIFLNTAEGQVIALDTRTGAEIWTAQVEPATTRSGQGGLFVSSPAVTTDAVIALVSKLHAPYAVALSKRDGTELWRSDPFVAQEGFYTNATAVIFDGMLLAGFSPDEGDPTARGGISIIDVKTGETLTTAWTIPDADAAIGHAGGGIWTAPAIDTKRKYAYAASGNPFSKQIEHENTNAILKIDVDRSRPTFGQVVDRLKGNIEQYDPVFKDAIDPACAAIGEDERLQLFFGNSAPCLQLDLDFGAAPNLFTDSNGDLLVGDLQKSGVYHVADATTMDRRWSAVVGGSCAVCNAAATAWDRNGSIYGVGTPGGAMVSVGADEGALQWASPVADGTHYQSTSSAGGVIFTIDQNGFLLGFDAATGAPLTRRPVAADLPAGTDVPVALSSSGIAVASGRLLVAAGNAVVSYRPPATPVLSVQSAP